MQKTTLKSVTKEERQRNCMHSANIKKLKGTTSAEEAFPHIGIIVQFDLLATKRAIPKKV